VRFEPDGGAAEDGITRGPRSGLAARPHSTYSSPRNPGGAAPADAAPELACLRCLLPAAVLADAAARARAIDVSAERVLIAAGAISEDGYVAALAQHLGLGFETLAADARWRCPLDDERLIESVPAGILPLRSADGLVFAVAPRDARHLLRFLARHPSAAPRLRLTTRRRLEHYVLRRAGTALGERAATLLARTRPAMSAAPRQQHRSGPVIAVTGLFGLFGLFAAATMLPHLKLSIELLLATIFVAWIVFRLVGILIALPAPRQPVPTADRDLPTYTIIAALYREAASVERLVRALEELDYPREKLDIQLVLEPNDHETLATLRRLPLRPEFSIIIAPDRGPRTKPKALNVALALATGAFVTVYDAEDRPERDQLRKAVAAFRASPRRLACVQARLTIDNTDDSWLAGLYTAEYAAQFDMLLPAWAALRVPLPLGGTSNHFRTDVLRRIGGWDSYNVTEDADIGQRLARLGYHAGVIDSATYEEAPSRIRPWLRQRTRWFKGWMQTWLVHMRHPAQLLREIGPFSFMMFQLIVGGNVLAALIHPIFIAALCHALASGGGSLHDGDAVIAVTAGLFGFSAVAGYLASIVHGGLGLMRHGLLPTAWVLLLTPLHWLLLSCAAWCAVLQLIRAPYHWDKTEHGLARTSRQDQHRMRALMRLERHLTAELAFARLRRRRGATRPLRDSAATRPPRPRASASGRTDGQSGHPCP